MIFVRSSSYSTVINISKRSKHWHSIESQYWQRSKMPTMHFQPSLPRLPIPKLEATCERYLAAQMPILSNEVFKKTQACVAQFRDSIGKELQEVLLQKDSQNKHTSYIYQPWFDMYLSDRKPLPINYNPVLVFNNDERPEYNNQLIKATNMLISSLRFYKSLKDNKLEPEVFHMNPKKSDTLMFRNVCSMVPPLFSWYAAYMFNAYALDMSQYHSLFNSTRIPKTGRDAIYQNSKAKHVLVQRNGHFYTFDVLDENDYILPPEKLLRNLKTILDDPVSPSEFPLGVLTTLNRNEWADIRKHFESLGNEKTINLIDSALFNICLDDVTIGSDLFMLCRNFLHGDGTNRWFDKSFSLIVTKDGVAGVNFEHSWGDGVAVLRYFQDIHKDSLTNAKIHPDTKPFDDDSNSVRKLDLNMDDKMKSAIKSSINNYKNICNSLDMNIVVNEGLGKNLCKKHQLSPDAIMQLGFQVAYHKLTGKCAASYESCSTSAFKHGRTETIRPCTSATKAYSVAINSKQPPSNDELKHLISQCSKKHGQLTKEAAMGQGFDRHLFALKLLASELNKPLPAIFEDPAYNAINHNIVSTSTLASPSVWAGGFGPVVSDGFGIAYYIRDDSIGVLVTSYPGANGKDYAAGLTISYEELLSVLQSK